MSLITLQTAAAVTGLSRRTLWRRIADGQLRREGTDGQALVDLGQLPLSVPADPGLIVQADGGDAEAQADLAALWRRAGKPEGAVYWLQRAAAQDHADSAYFLAEAYFGGGGVEPDPYLAMMWLGKSAALGHPLARVRMDQLLAPFAISRAA